MAACLWCAGLQVELAQTCQARPEFEPRASLVGRGAPFYLIGQRTTTTWQLCEAAMQLINVLLAGVSVLEADAPLAMGKDPPGAVVQPRVVRVGGVETREQAGRLVSGNLGQSRVISGSLR